MQDLVGVGVPNPAKQPWIGEGPLERMILRSERGGEGSQIRAEHFKAARVDVAQSRFTLHYVKRGAALRSCFGQGKTTRREIERSQSTLWLQLDAWVAPVQASGDHQVQ